MVFALLLAASEPIDLVPAPTPDCSYDVDAMLTLDRDGFDQDMDGGWRPLGAKEGCEIAAAELIREWRHEKRDHTAILYWHEGQLRAFGGQTEEAVALFGRTYKAPDLDADFGWNHYVSGSIAFLSRDRERLRKSIENLSAIPVADNKSFTMPDGTVVELEWPPNLSVLEAFERCWEKPYAEAYSSAECRRAKE